VLRRQQKLTHLRLLPSKVGVGNDEDYGSKFDLQVAYRKSEINDGLSDYVKLRLLISRELALKKYQEVWG